MRRAGEWRFRYSSNSNADPDDFTRLAFDIEGNRPAANGAILSRRVSALGGVDTDRKQLAAIRALDLDVFDEVHALRRSLEFQPGCIAPEIFERIIRPLLFRENVNHHVAVVGDDPLALRKTINGQGLDVMIFPKAFFHFVCDGLEVWLTGSGTDEEEIGERGNTAQVDGDDAFRLFIGGYFGTELGETFGVDGIGRFKNWCGKGRVLRSKHAPLPAPNTESSRRVQHACVFLWRRYRPDG